ncbi:MAG TPA: DUF1499 domain-containing protein [Rhizomicrobium sp.]|jgi:hypothetical protein|nr:DUF1499 domain-containing protein [Rhizomicrobium sp.]
MRSTPTAAIVSLVCFVVGGAIALTGSYGVRLGWWELASGLKIAAPGFVIAIGGSIAGLLWLWRALSSNNSAGWRIATAGLVGSLLIAYEPVNQARLYLLSPPIHDVSTDPEEPPSFDALLAQRADATNAPAYDGSKVVRYRGKQTQVALAQKTAYPEIKPYVALLNPKQDPSVHPVNILFWRGFARAKEAGFAIAAYNEHDGTIEGTHTSFWFGQIADVAIRVRPAGKIGARLDIRAESRNGENDMGAAAAIVKDYLASLR